MERDPTDTEKRLLEKTQNTGKNLDVATSSIDDEERSRKKSKMERDHQSIDTTIEKGLLEKTNNVENLTDTSAEVSLLEKTNNVENLDEERMREKRKDHHQSTATTTTNAEISLLVPTNTGHVEGHIEKTSKIEANECEAGVETVPPRINTSGTIRPGSKVRAPRGRSRRLSNAVVVNFRRSKVTLKWHKPGNTTSRVHIDDVVFLKDGEEFEESDSDLDYDLTELEIERRSALQRSKQRSTRKRNKKSTSDTPERRAMKSHFLRQKAAEENLAHAKNKKNKDDDEDFVAPSASSSPSSSEDDEENDTSSWRTRRHRSAHKKIDYDESKNHFFDEKEMIEENTDAKEEKNQSQYRIESFLGMCTKTSSHWEKLSTQFNTAYVVGGSMDTSSSTFECEHGCGFESENAKVVEAHERTCGPDVLSDRILVKWKHLSYLHCTWETEKAIRRMATVHEIQKFQRFKEAHRKNDTFESLERERKKRCVVKRILDVDVLEDNFMTYFVKWDGDLDYDEATWVSLEDLPANTRVDEFNAFRSRPDQMLLSKPFYFRPFKTKKYVKYTETTLPGCSEDGMRLREYQVKGVNWLVTKWLGGTFCTFDESLTLRIRIIIIIITTHRYKHHSCR